MLHESNFRKFSRINFFKLSRLHQKRLLEEKLTKAKNAKLLKEKEYLEQHKGLERLDLFTQQTIEASENLQREESIVNEQNREANQVLEKTENLEDDQSEINSVDENVSDDQFMRVLEQSDLFRIIRSLSEKQSDNFNFEFVDSEISIGDKLKPTLVDSLSSEEKIIFNFSKFILNLITNQCSLRPITLLVAETVPQRADGNKNAFLGWFSYDSINRFLYIRRQKLNEKNPGHLYVMIAHCAAHIKIGDLSNDFNPQFRVEFYNILAQISEYIFTARITPSITSPEEFKTNKIQECSYIKNFRTLLPSKATKKLLWGSKASFEAQL